MAAEVRRQAGAGPRPPAEVAKKTSIYLFEPIPYELKQLVANDNYVALRN